MNNIKRIFGNISENEDRVRSMLSSFFVFLCVAVLSGCAKEPVMYIKDDSEENVETAQPPEEDQPFKENEESDDQLICVHLCGAVNFQGVYELSAGSRLNDAVILAGGLSEDACFEAVNLAERLKDEQHIYIPTVAEVKERGIDVTGEALKSNGAGLINNDSDDLININTADKTQLMTLTGIGEVKAESIIDYREANGGFDSIEDITKVSGIGKASFDKIKDRIKVR